MVSGLVTSPWLQLRIFSGEAREMRIESKSAIKFARSYGEDLKVASSSYSKKRKLFCWRRMSHESRPGLFSRPRAPYPALHAASSSTQHRDRATATRESAR